MQKSFDFVYLLIRCSSRTLVPLFFEGYSRRVCVDNTANCWYVRYVKRVCLFGTRLASYRVKQRLLHVATFQSNNRVMERNWKNIYILRVCVCTYKMLDCLFYCDSNMKIHFFPSTWKCIFMYYYRLAVLFIRV